MATIAPVLPTRLVVAPAPDAEVVTRLAADLGVPRALAGLLALRGWTDSAAARHFLRPPLDDLADPLTLLGMREAVELIAGAVRRGQPILVHGDYDVDGQCSTALLTRALRVAGATVVPFVPHRIRDGYDFGAAGLAAAEAAGAGLILTCDCGISAVTTVQAARERGIDVVVTDHHLPGAALPPASAIVDPQQPGDRSGLTQLCGTGIAFKLVQALVPALGLPANLPYHLLDLVALATVADVVPLTGENRTLVRHGLRVLQKSRWPGLRGLIRVSGLGAKEVRAGHLGFILGPRLNAAGRVGDAMDGLRLLLTDSAAEATELATLLERLNGERQALDQRMLEDALAQVARIESLSAGLVIAGDGWHPGVVGIVASRVVERFGRPAFLIAFDGDTGRGSGRSISAFDLHGALTACGDLLERYGGHHMAAGLTIRRDRLEAFRERFASLAGDRLQPEQLGPEQRIDLELPLNEATAELEKLCRFLEPCGMGNASPVFGARGVRLTRRARVGGSHLKGVLEGQGAALEAIGFGMADRLAGLTDGLVDVAFRLDENEYQGQRHVQARLLAVVPAAVAGR
jgi:single-stranded-DNA-specific exonuclease